MNTLYKIYKDKSQKGLDLSLTEACKEGDLEVVRFLLTSPDLMFNADINESNNDPIFTACDYENMEIVEYLLNSDELNVHADKYFALNYCCNEDKVEILEHLLLKSNLDIDLNKNNSQAFSIALAKNSDKVLKFFIFDLNLKRTDRIEELLNEYKRENIKSWFELREVNKELSKELNSNSTSSKKLKV